MAFLVFTIISTFLGQALNGKRCTLGSAVAPKLDKMSYIAVIISQYLKNDLIKYHECFSR